MRLPLSFLARRSGIPRPNQRAASFVYFAAALSEAASPTGHIPNQIEQISAPCGIDLIIEHIRKGRAEDALPPPMLDLKQPCSAVPQQGTSPIGFSGASTRMVAPFDLTTPLGPFFRVAEVARRRDFFAPGHFRAANPRVEGRIGPLNLRSTAHALRLWSRANRSLIGRLSDISIKGTKNEQIIRPRSPHHPLEPRGKKPIQPREPRLVMRPGIRQRAQRAV